MKQSSLSVWLKTIIIIVALCGLAGLIFVLPALGHSLADSSAMPSAYLPWLVLLWVVALPCYAALVIAWRIADRIGADRSFCRENVSDMGKIARLMFACGLMSLLMAIPAGFLFGRVWFDCVLACLGCAGLGVIAYALACLLRGAVELQEENELTV